MSLPDGCEQSSQAVRGHKEDLSIHVASYGDCGLRGTTLEELLGKVICPSLVRQ